MGNPVFISYSHRQAAWVHGRLAPALRASGAAVTLDVVDGQAGRSLDAQMRDWVDSAAHVVAVLSPAYLRSDACRLEWDRAMGRDPGFLKGGTLIPVLRESCDPMPDALRGTGAPLYVDLRDDGPANRTPETEARWQTLFRVWNGTLGARAVDWLWALDTIRRDLTDRKHVSLLAAPPVRWAALIEALKPLLPEPAAVVDLAKPANYDRPNMLEDLLRQLGLSVTLDRTGPRSDLVGFSKAVEALPPRRVVFKNFHICRRFDDFGAHLFDALRYHAMEDGRVLTLLVHTTEPFDGHLLPPGHLVSAMTPGHVALMPAP